MTDAYLRAEVAGPVLLAAALAEDDEFGFFGADVVDDAGALERLVELDVLQARDIADGRRYRFLNPLLPPYVVMRGLADGSVKANDLFTGPSSAKGG